MNAGCLVHQPPFKLWILRCISTIIQKWYEIQKLLGSILTYNVTMPVVIPNKWRTRRSSILDITQRSWTLCVLGPQKFILPLVYKANLMLHYHSNHRWFSSTPLVWDLTVFYTYGRNVSDVTYYLRILSEVKTIMSSYIIIGSNFKAILLHHRQFRNWHTPCVT